MDLMILNTNLDAVTVVDNYKSVIWTDRYWQYGDFELYMIMSDSILSQIKQDYYLQRRGSDRAMIIEKILIETDAENGNTITVTGRSLESILDRRIVWGQKTFTGNLQDKVEELLNLCIISPSNPNRKISNFVFKRSTDPIITSLKIDAQYTGDNLYDVINGICEEAKIGFKITLSSDKQFVFELYSGVDRSYDQTTRPYVIFSPKFDNVLNSNYMESRESFKNVALIGGEGEGASRKYTAVGNTSGLNRRELFVDARDISSDVGDDQTLTTEEYEALLNQRGREKLSENIDIVSFEGQMETSTTYQFGKDFFEGDIVQIENEYGHGAKVRVLEVVTSENEEGVFVYPTFQTLEKEGE